MLALLLVLCAFPQRSYAASVTISTDGAYDLAANGHSDGDTISISAGCTVSLIGNSATTYNNFRIVCGTGVDLTLQNINIDDADNDDKCPLTFAGSDNSLTVSGTCSLIAGSNAPAVSADSMTALEIMSDGLLVATGGYHAAGVGGGENVNAGTIMIKGGSVDATGGYGGAGIGGGENGSGGTINIYNGTVNADGGGYAAGIGGGDNASEDVNNNVSSGTITISGGTVNASGGYYASGIGGGSYGQVGTITISGGNVDAVGYDYGAGIGSGQHGIGGTITITGGTVNARAFQHGTGIGGGYGSDGGTIDISGGTVMATKGDGAPYDIGDGEAGTGGTLHISGKADVFLRNNACITPATTTHRHLIVNQINDGKAYGFDMPSGWTAPFGIYIQARTLTYNANGGSGSISPVT